MTDIEMFEYWEARGKAEAEQERDDWQARAEDAENELRELRENTLLALGLNPIDVTDGMEDVTIAYLLGGWKERIAELEAENADLRGLPMSAHTRKLGALHRENEELRQHIAALESQLAAQAWRPVTEPPLVEEAQCLLCSFTKRYGYEYKIASWVSVVENEWTGRREHRPGGYWYDGEGEYIDIDDWQEWQPLPAPPND